MAGKPVEIKIYPSFGDNGHTMFGDRKGFSVFVQDVVRFLDAAFAR